MKILFNNMTNIKKFLSNPKNNAMSTLVFITFFLLIGPLLPGVNWFSLGDFSLDMVNFFHTVMVPFVFLLLIYTSELLNLYPLERKAVNLSTYPVLFLTLLGLIFFYPANTQNLDYVIQALRDVWMLVLAILFFLSLIVFPFREKDKFRKIWGAYLVVLVGTVSIGIASIMGMIYEYGSLFGFSSLPWFNDDVAAWGGLNTFLGNLLTSHSHQMLPALMAGIVALATICFGYEKLSMVKRSIVNIGLVIAVFGIISMSYIYFISSFGTYFIPAIFISGSYGMNGLALDDSQTGIIGIGALVTIIGLYYTLSSRRSDKLLQASEMYTWIATMAVMTVVGYSIEFNETYYGFGSSGVPPNGGSGYLFDMAFTDGHLLFAFFLMPLLAGIILVFIHFIKEHDMMKKTVAFFAGAGITIGGLGVLVYTMTLSWYIEAIGLGLVIVSILIMTLLFMETPITNFMHSLNPGKQPNRKPLKKNEAR